MDPKKHIKSCHSETIWDITKVPIKKIEWQIVGNVGDKIVGLSGQK